MVINPQIPHLFKKRTTHLLLLIFIACMNSLVCMHNPEANIPAIEQYLHVRDFEQRPMMVKNLKDLLELHQETKNHAAQLKLLENTFSWASLSISGDEFKELNQKASNDALNTSSDEEEFEFVCNEVEQKEFEEFCWFFNIKDESQTHDEKEAPHNELNFFKDCFTFPDNNQDVLTQAAHIESMNEDDSETDDEEIPIKKKKLKKWNCPCGNKISPLYTSLFKHFKVACSRTKSKLKNIFRCPIKDCVEIFITPAHIIYHLKAHGLICGVHCKQIYIDEEAYELHTAQCDKPESKPRRFKNRKIEK